MSEQVALATAPQRWTAPLPIELSDRAKPLLERMRNEHGSLYASTRHYLGPDMDRLVNLELATGRRAAPWPGGKTTQQWIYAITPAGRQWLENCTLVEEE